MPTPTIAVSYGDDADVAVSRLEWLSADFDWTLHVTRATDFSVMEAEPVIEHVGQGQPLLLVHFLHLDAASESSSAATLEQLDRIATDIRTSFPGIALREWSVVLTGRLLDPLETRMITALGQNMRGVIVTAASTNTTVAHPPNEEAAFAADLAVIVGTSGLETEIGQIGGAWMGSAASATYSTRRLQLAVAALQIIETVDGLLLPGDEDVAYEMGEQWMDDLQLGTELSWRKLLDSASGGSLLSKVRLSDTDFAHIPVESWSDAIATRYDLISMNDVPFIENRIAALRDERFDDLRTMIGGEILTQLEETANLSATAAYSLGMRTALERAIADVERERPDLPEYDVSSDRKKLRDLLRWLPFGPAVAVRLLAVALAVLVGMAAVLGTGAVPVDVTVSIWPGIAGATVLVVGWALYRRRLRRTIRVRDRLTRGMEEQLVATVERFAVESHAALLKDLSAWLGEAPDPPPQPEADVPEAVPTVAEWLAWLRFQIEACRPELNDRSTARSFGEVGKSRYAIDIPLSDTVETGALLDETDEADSGIRIRSLLAIVRDALLSGTLVVPTRDRIIDEWSESVAGCGPLPWRTIGDVLTDSTRTADSVRTVLQTDLTPTGGSSTAVRHYLVVPDESTATLLIPSDNASADGVMARLTDTRTTDTQRFAAMIHLYPLQIETEGGAP